MLPLADNNSNSFDRPLSRTHSTTQWARKDAKTQRKAIARWIEPSSHAGQEKEAGLVLFGIFNEGRMWLVDPTKRQRYGNAFHLLAWEFPLRLGVFACPHGSGVSGNIAPAATNKFSYRESHEASLRCTLLFPCFSYSYSASPRLRTSGTRTRIVLRSGASVRINRDCIDERLASTQFEQPSSTNTSTTALSTSRRRIVGQRRLSAENDQNKVFTANVIPEVCS